MTILSTCQAEILLCFCIAVLQYSCIDAGQYIRNANSIRISVGGVKNNINPFKVQVQHSMEAARIRRKRKAGLLASVSDNGGFTADRLRVGSSAPGDLPYLSGHNLTMWTSVRFGEKDQIFVGTRRGDLVLLDVSDRDRVAQPVAYGHGDFIGNKVKAFSYGDQQWFVILQSSLDGSAIYLYQRVGEYLERRQPIQLDGAVDFDLITVRGIHYLAVSTYWTKLSHGNSYRGNVTLYHWTKTQFDSIAYRPTSGARSVICWSLDGTLYFSVSQETNDDGDAMIGSPVYLYNAKDGDSLVLLDKPATKGPKKVAHFTVAGNHYLIFIGHYDAQIFWWSGDQFLLWQTVSGTAGASDVSILALWNGEVVLVIALKEEIFFLTLDATGHYVITFTMQFSGYTIESLQFIFNGIDYYALALFAQSDIALPHPIWKLKMDRYDFPDATSIDSLIQCLSTLRDIIKDRENELAAVEMDMERVWLTNKDQVVVSDVVIKGSVSSSNIVADEAIVKTEYGLVDITPTDIENNVSLFYNQKMALDAQLGSVLYKSRDQEIPGPMIFSTPISVPTLNWQTVSHDLTINGVDVSRIASLSLKKFGDQVFRNNVAIHSIHTGAVYASNLNGIPIDDIVLLNGVYEITGKWQFNQLTTSNITAYSVNGIPIESLVLTHGIQEIEELKTFQSLASNIINVDGLTNGEDLSLLQSQVVTLDTVQEIGADLEFRAPLTADDVTVGSINSALDLAALNEHAVKKLTPQIITGTNIFSNGMLVQNDVELRGLLNGVDLNDLATLNSAQNFTGALKFSSLDVRGNVRVNTVNGKDLATSVVLRNKDQFVEGMKFFGNQLIANNIELTNGVTIDGVDVSEAAQAMVRHNEGVISHLNPIFNDIVVLGNVTAYQGINGFLVSDLPNTVWLKSYYQNITTPVHLTHFTAESDIYASSVKGHSLDTDVLHVLGDERIGENKVFQHKIYVNRNINIVEGKLLGGADISSFKEDAYTQKQVQGNAIYGTKTFLSLEVYGGIQTESVNGMSISTNFLKPSDPQTIVGDTQLNSVVIDSDLSVGSIGVNSVNGVSFEGFAEQAVLKDSIHPREINSKLFVHLNANHLSVSEFGLIDGVNLLDLTKRAVMLNVPQQVTGEKDFENDINLQNETLAALVNGVELDALVGKVVFTDSVSEITGHKMFSRAIVANDLTTSSINGIDVVSLADNFMSKTSPNDVTEMFHFENDLNIGSLSVIPPAKLDGISLDVTAKINEDLIVAPVTTIDADIIVSSDLFTYGIVNYCNLNEVITYGLRLSGEQQTLPEHFQFDQLRIQGNLYVQTINDIPLAELQNSLVGDNGHQVVSGDLHIYPGVSATYLDVNGLVNATDINVLLGDAVLRTSSQVITGRKTFLGNLGVDVFTNNVEVFVGDVNGVDMKELATTAVWKSGYQTIQGEKSFGDLNAMNATFYGTLNGISIPSDVVLTSDPGTIPGDVHFAKGVEIYSNLTVYGLIDDIDLNSAIYNVVNVFTDEVLEADITFTDDIQAGSMNVEGMINDILLDMVVSTNRDSQIDGFKIFDHVTMNNVAASLVNGLDVNNLIANVLSRNRNEILGNVQTFLEPIYAQDTLTVDWVNGISLAALVQKHLESKSGLQSSINSLKQLESSQDKALALYLSGANYRTTSFAYFILFQELDIKGSVKVIATDNQWDLTESLYQTSVMWTSQVYCQQKSCCSVEYSYWLSADQEGKVSSSNGPLSGRFFPIGKFDLKRTLIVWSNSSMPQSEGCYHGVKETVIGSLSGSGEFETYHVIGNSQQLVDVVSFREDGYTYIVAAYYDDKVNNAYGNTVVYVGDQLKYVWQEHQYIPSYGVLSMDLTINVEGQYGREKLLAIGSGLGSYPDSYSSVYRWNSTGMMFELVQSIPSQNVASIHWIRAGPYVLLAVAGVDNWYGTSAKCYGVTKGGQIDLYIYDYELTWIQSIPLEDVTSMTSFMLEGETYLAAVSQASETIHILQWRGYSSFVIIQSMYSSEVSHISSYWIRDELFLSISGSGSTKILKAIIRGKNKLVSEFLTYNNTLLEQGDQPSSQTVKTGC